MKHSRAQACYMWGLILLGLFLLVWSICYLAMRQAVPLDRPGELVTLFVLLVLCRLLPIEIAKDKYMDISFLPVLACAMAFGPEVAIILFALSPLFMWQQQENKEWIYPLRDYPVKELFNTANIVISVSVGGIVLHIMGGFGPDFAFPGSILPTCLFTVVTLLCNILLFTLYFLVGRQGTFHAILIDGMLGMLPSMLCTIPLGLLIAALLRMYFGYALLMLFMLPLLLARYSFKLYLDNKSMHIRTISALSKAIEARDTYTRGHSQRVSVLSVLLARQMGCREGQVERIRMAALLHDVGKIGISDQILQKPGPLTEEEFAIIRRHPVVGEQIIREIRLPQEVNQGVLYHHRYFDGSGYPDQGPSGKDLPLSARIITLADAYDAITSDRPYRPGLNHEQVCTILEQHAGTQFDPAVVEAFAAIADRVPAAMQNLEE